MAISYSKHDTGATFGVGNKFVGGSPSDTYSLDRGFLRVSLAGSGLSAGDIESVALRTYVASVVNGSENYRLRSSYMIGSWMFALDATAGDFTSTKAYIEVSSKTISSTGWKEWAVNKSHLSLTTWTWFRLTSLGENEKDYQRITINSQDAASNRPHLRIIPVAGVPLYYQAFTP